MSVLKIKLYILRIPFLSLPAYLNIVAFARIEKWSWHNRNTAQHNSPPDQQRGKIHCQLFPFSKLQQSEIRRVMVSYPRETRRQNDLSISSYLCKSNLPIASKLNNVYGQENRCCEWEKMAYSSREGRSENYETRNYCWIIQSSSTSFYSQADNRSN